MNKTFLTALLASISITTANTAQAKDLIPFGISQGTSMKHMDKIAKERDMMVIGGYNLDKIPTDHLGKNLFERYWVLASPKQGVCRIRAITPEIKDDPDFSKSIRIYKKIKKILQDQEGPHSAAFEGWLDTGSNKTKPKVANKKILDSLSSATPVNYAITTLWEKRAYDIDLEIFNWNTFKNNETNVVVVSYSYPNLKVCEEENLKNSYTWEPLPKNK